jgi:hypothetical protein
VKTLTIKTNHLKVEANNTVEKVEEKFEDKEENKSRKQRLKFTIKKLEYERTLRV